MILLPVLEATDILSSFALPSSKPAFRSFLRISRCATLRATIAMTSDNIKTAMTVRSAPKMDIAMRPSTVMRVPGMRYRGLLRLVPPPTPPPLSTDELAIGGVLASGSDFTGGRDGDGLGIGEGEGEGEGEGLGEGLGEGEGEGEGDGLGLGLGLGEGLGDGDGEGLGLGLGEGLGEGLGDGDGEGLGEGSGSGSSVIPCKLRLW